MPNDPHQRAAEFHELAAQAHRAAAGHRAKQHHLTGQEYSKQAIEHANKAFQASQEALREPGLPGEVNWDFSKFIFALYV